MKITTLALKPNNLHTLMHYKLLLQPLRGFNRYIFGQNYLI